MTDYWESCKCCGARIRTSRAVMLEWDQRIEAAHDFGNIPLDKNQGGFSFGGRCASKERNRAKKLLAERRL